MISRNHKGRKDLQSLLFASKEEIVHHPVECEAFGITAPLF